MPKSPSNPSPEYAKQICDRLRLGASFETAAKSLQIVHNVKVDRANTWYARGLGQHPTKRPTRLLIEFAKQVEAAEAEGEITLVGAIVKGSRGGDRIYSKTLTRRFPDGSTSTSTTEKKSAAQWSGSAWLLSRRYPERWDRVAMEDARQPGLTALAEQLKAISSGKYVDPRCALLPVGEADGVIIEGEVSRPALPAAEVVK